MKYRVLISAPYFIPVIDTYAGEFERHGIDIVVANVTERLSEGELLPLVGDVDGIICGDDRFTTRVMDAAPRLKVICKWGTGIDSIDCAAATQRGIQVCRTPNAFTEPVADSIIGYILSFARNIPWMDQKMRAGIWKKIPGRALNESIIGVIGVGNIGRAVLRRARPFGAKLLGNDIRLIEEHEEAEFGFEAVDMDRLLQAADFVCVTCDLNPTSHHLISRSTLAAMKPTAILVNAARGPIVDEGALISALKEGEIGGAAMDVFEEEPLALKSGLLGLENTLLAPHNSNSSPTAWKRVHENSIRMVLDCLTLGNI